MASYYFQAPVLALAMATLVLASCQRTPGSSPSHGEESPSPVCRTELGEDLAETDEPTGIDEESLHTPTEEEQRVAAAFIVLTYDAVQNGGEPHPALTQSALLNDVGNLTDSYPGLFKPCDGGSVQALEQRVSLTLDELSCETNCSSAFTDVLAEYSGEILLDKLTDRIAANRLDDMGEELKQAWNTSGSIAGALSSTELEDIGEAAGAVVGVVNKPLGTAIGAMILATQGTFDLLGAKVEYDDCQAYQDNLCEVNDNDESGTENPTDTENIDDTTTGDVSGTGGPSDTENTDDVATGDLSGTEDPWDAENTGDATDAEDAEDILDTEDLPRCENVSVRNGQCCIAIPGFGEQCYPMDAGDDCKCY